MRGWWQRAWRRVVHALVGRHVYRPVVLFSFPDLRIVGRRCVVCGVPADDDDALEWLPTRREC